MERKTTARKPKTTTAAKGATAPKTTAKRTAAKTTPKGATAPKRTTAKGAAKGSARTTTAPKTAPRATGPTPDRIRLAGEVAKLRAKGAKWNEIAATTGKSEPTLAKLRKDVRRGVFAAVSPVASRVRSDAF